MAKVGSSPAKKRRKDTDPSSGPNPTTGSSNGSRKRRAVNSAGTLSPTGVPTFYHEYCELPFTLSTILVDEFDCITRKDFSSPRSVHVLPARVTVRQVLQHYQRKRCNSKNTGCKEKNDGSTTTNDNKDSAKQKQNERIKRFCESLAFLFDDALPVCLLYHEERPQYEALQADENLRLNRPCEIYGTTYLLRLLQRLPILLRAEPRKEMDELGPMIADLLVLLQKNRQACFKDSYREPKHDELLAWEKEALASCENNGGIRTTNANANSSSQQQGKNECE